MRRVIVTFWTRLAAAVVGVVVCLTVLSAAELDVRVKDVQTPASAVRTTIEIRDLIPDRFKKMMDEGRVLHLRVQAELWESRPIWDRLVYPAIVRVFRVGRAPAGRDVAITDPNGAATTYPSIPSSVPVVVELGDRSRLTATEKYYVHVVATLGMLAESEADEVGDAVFGGEGDAGGLAALGKIVVKSAMKVSDYLQSVSAEAKSRKLAGAEILRRP
jgi:hypothetical protein